MKFRTFFLHDLTLQLLHTKSQSVFFVETDSDRLVKLKPDTIIRGIK